MKYESIGNSAASNEAIPGAGSAKVTTGPVALEDAWRRVRAWWASVLRSRLRQPRRLRLCESLPLGERRFVAVVEFERSRFLLGGTSASLVLLARLGKVPGEVQVEAQSEAQGEDDSPVADRPPRIFRESRE